MGKVILSGAAPLAKVPGGTKLKEIAVGSTLSLNVDGVSTEFLVVHQGNPDSSVYDESCNGTWLMAKDIYENRQWHSSNVNDYANSTIHKYLNGTFFNQLDENLQSVIKEVKIPYRAGSGYSTTVTKGANGLSTKVFLLSATEVGAKQTYMPYKEGVELSYFSGCVDNAADDKRIAYLNGSATIWWLRSPNCNSNLGGVNAMFVNSDGNLSHDRCGSGSWGIRPVFIMPSDLIVDGDGNIIV